MIGHLNIINGTQNVLKENMDEYILKSNDVKGPSKNYMEHSLTV